MNKVVICLAFGVMAVVGCAAAPEEEPEASTQSEIRSNPRASRSSECALGDGLYCGQNGVEGAVNVLYRCNGDEVRAAELCVGPCVKMPDGLNDRCKETAAIADQPTPQQPDPQPRPQPPQANAPLCGNGLTCAGGSTVGASACRQSESSATSIFCCPVPGSTISSGRCVAPAPRCGTGLTCASSSTIGAGACRQLASSTTNIFCCPVPGSKISNGRCVAPTPICGTGLYCASGPTSGASACRQTASSPNSIYCCPPGQQISGGRCI